MGGWHTVLDEQLDLLHHWQSPSGAIVAETFGESMQQVESDMGTAPLGDVLAKQLRVKMIETLSRAEPVYVDRHMMDLVEAAAESFQPETFQATDLIAPSAFVVLPRALSMLDRHKKPCAFSAIAWTSQVFMVPGRSTTSGVLLSLYTNVLSDTDADMEVLDSEGGSSWRQRVAGSNGTPYALFHVTPWEFGSSPGEEDEGRGDFWKPVQSFMRLTLQTIIEREGRRPPRGSARRWKRYDLPERLITVVRLRRPRASRTEGESGPVEWSHQWITSGHWRNQWYPSLGLHRQIWISPYLKGPPDKPLLVKHGRAFEFVK